MPSEGKIIRINNDTKNFDIDLKNGKCTICNISNIDDIKIGDYIHFDNVLGGSYFYNSRTERFSASIVYCNIDIKNAISYST